MTIYHAGVKEGDSAYCPSCYVDRGQRTTTDLWFEMVDPPWE